jgi:hypothetical protein
MHPLSRLVKGLALDGLLNPPSLENVETPISPNTEGL